MEKRLYNKKSKEELIKNLRSEPFKRITCSFYKYTKIKTPLQFRDNIYLYLDSLKILGRVYVASEGINAQISVPEYVWNKFKIGLQNFRVLENVPIKKAISDGDSFYKLVGKEKKRDSSLWRFG